MDKYICTICQYEYDPANNNNVDFKDLADDWRCPICSAKKDRFEVEE